MDEELPRDHDLDFNPRGRATKRVMDVLGRSRTTAEGLVDAYARCDTDTNQKFWDGVANEVIRRLGEPPGEN